MLFHNRFAAAIECEIFVVLYDRYNVISPCGHGLRLYCRFERGKMALKDMAPWLRRIAALDPEILKKKLDVPAIHSLDVQSIRILHRNLSRCESRFYRVGIQAE